MGIYSIRTAKNELSTDGGRTRPPLLTGTVSRPLPVWSLNCIAVTEHRGFVTCASLIAKVTRLVVHSGSETTKSMTSTPSEMATAKLRELVQADGSLDQEIRDAFVADLGDAQPSRLKALNGALAGERTDAASRAEGKQLEGSAG